MILYNANIKKSDWCARITKEVSPLTNKSYHYESKIHISSNKITEEDKNKQVYVDLLGQLPLEISNYMKVDFEIGECCVDLTFISIYPINKDLDIAVMIK